MFFIPLSLARAVCLAFGLGLTFGLGLALIVFVPSLALFGWFSVFQVIFHLWEYFFNALFHPSKNCTNGE